MRKLRYLGLVPALGMVALLSSVTPSGASSHREAPLIAQDPVADTTDVYAFVSPDRPDTVTLQANWIPLEEPAGGPNFFQFGDDVRYQINIDNNGDAVDDVVYEFRFQTKILDPHTFLYNTGPITPVGAHDYSSTFNLRQTYEVTRVDKTGRHLLATDLNTPPANIGPRSTPHYDTLANQAVYRLSDGTKVFAGQRDDPFFVDLGSIFDLGGLRPFNQAHLIPLPTAPGIDGVGGFNVHTISIQVPMNELTYDGRPPRGLDDPHPNSVIGVYSETQRREVRVLGENGKRSNSGDWVNVSRLGNPLVNEVVIPLGKKDRFNASEPVNDGQFLKYVLDPELARLIPVLYPGIQTPPPPRDDLVSVFLTGIPGLNQPPNVTPSEMLRLNMAIPPVPESTDASNPFGGENHLGVIGGDNAGWPNGRRLADDVTDVALRAVAGGYPLTPAFDHSPNNILGDGVNSNDRPFLAAFPYMATPHQGYRHQHHQVGSTSTCC